ncbi:hypothetical protein N7548_00375 [Acholeplasma manati]|uniref:DUF7670 domain-containing protein n=1 Tax=Paracholeplasma manati TaxID=591373 RepID=A0ABT2Y3G5_9MOLU|nr:hypothetical protein [Paracholeplasma manati]MCV2231281.1 hypothetical protein [Paracholeplasma manati]
MSIKTLVQWSPRVLSILFTLFLSMFSFDVFEMAAPWYELLLGFLIHNIPTLILAIVIFLAWKRPLIGSIVFAAAGLFNTILVFTNQGLEDWLSVVILGLPAIIIAILYYIDYRFI